MNLISKTALLNRNLRIDKPGAAALDLRQQRGIALVITLIFVSITAFLAITFLIVSQRERGSVTVASNQTDARFAADAALERAKVEILAPILAYKNDERYDQIVSTNYINTRGFSGSLAGANPTNVNFDYYFDDFSGNPLSAGNFIDVVGNLQYNPRVPVFVPDPLKPTVPPEFRYYLDLNRNGRHDPSGYVPVINANYRYVNLDGSEGNVVQTNQPPPLPTDVQYQHFIGDPEWIGILERPELPHSGDNRFIARYAYLVVPEGKTLDANFIHNQAATRTLDLANDGFMRNQGVGSWEINLAAFLADLNPNIWLPGTAPNNGYYNYDRLNGFANKGRAFEDAQSLLAYRYNSNYNNLRSVAQLFPPVFPLLQGAETLFQRNHIDDYADGPLQTGVAGISEVASPDITTQPWPGADNPNHFFTPEDFFNKTASFFSNHLYSAGTSNSSFDSHTFYRMTAQLGTDSGVGAPRMNLNYDNLVQKNSQNISAATNFYEWRPLDFFTNAADRLLSTLPTNLYGYVTTTNIPIYSITPTVTNFMYTPAVHRLLQVAANLYDATTNRVDDLPHVYRPIFTRSLANGVTNVWISGYQEVTSDAVAMFNRPCVDVEFLATSTSLPTVISNYNVYNVPWVVGAKTNLPNFNEFNMVNGVQVSRKLEFRRRNINGDANAPNNTVVATNQLFVLTLTNSMANELWYSYSNVWNLSSSPLRMILTNEFSVQLTNMTQGYDMGFTYFGGVTNGIDQTYSSGVWTGYTNKLPRLPVSESFRLPLPSAVVLTQANVMALQSSSGGFTSVTRGRYLMPGSAGDFPLPRWGVNLHTRVRYGLFDDKTGRVVDYVALSKGEDTMDLAWELAGRANGLPIESNPNAPWYTNQLGGSYGIPPAGPSVGLWQQILVGIGQVQQADWYSYDSTVPNGQDKEKARTFFAYNLGFPSRYNGETNIYKTNIFSSPYNPYRTIYQHLAWEANDPLVHYTVSDLTDLGFSENIFRSSGKQANLPKDTIGGLNRRYSPWGIKPGGESVQAYNLALKDPLMFRPDNWMFPTNKFPSIGWMGRVHRGTPWQTIYLKSDDIGATDLRTWQLWSGNANDIDAASASPVADRKFFDLFTAVANDNADRGRMSVNQTNLAAWSAVLSGVITLSNSSPAFNPAVRPVPVYDPVVIEPAGQGGGGAPLQRIVDGINATRSGTNFYGTFKYIGDVFATPELTVKSPFLNTDVEMEEFDINDAAMERIPQQILGLLKQEDTRLVIYAYGQSLKPADRSIVYPSLLCTNYQVTGETAIRAVVSVKRTGDGGFRTEVESYNLLPPE